MLFLLLSNPEKRDVLVQEIRVAFQSRTDMTFQSEPKLVYLNACISEALRVYNPAPSAMPYLTPAGGMTVDGVFVP